MKFTCTLAVVVLLIALLLPLVFGPANLADRIEATPSPAASEITDADYEFTVLSDGTLETVTMADWLPGVLAGEMPVTFSDEAIKAQAVAARTYIMSKCGMTTPAHPDADVCDDAGCCKAHLTEDELKANWGENYDNYWSRMCELAQKTDGQYLTYDDKPIQALFHSSSAGRTEDSGALWNAIPYLVSVESPETEADVPNFVSTVEVTVTDFAATLSEAGIEADLTATPDTWIGELRLDDSGRVAAAVIGGAEVEGGVLRDLFSLRSTAFTLEYINGDFLFTVTGYGHGVGMSQYGANVMAQDGSDYAQILAHYYPGTSLRR